jgi:hypothetical protein
MSPRSLITSDAPEVLIAAVYGDLQITGWERDEILLQSNNDDTAVLKHEGSIVHIKTTGDCLLHLPKKTRLTVVTVHGGARLMMMAGLVTIRKVLGSLAIDDVGSVQVESVYGEFLARRMSGDLTIDQVLGDTSVGEVMGNCNLGSIAGNLDLRNAGCDVHASIRGDAHVRLQALTGSSYKIDASGNIIFSAPHEIDAVVQISSRSNDITLNLPDGNERLPVRSHELTLGNGAASIMLTASGSVSFLCGEGSPPGEQEPDQTFTRESGDSSQKISDEQASQFDIQARTIDAQMADLSESIAHAGVAPTETDRIMRRVQDSTKRANLRAQEKMQRAREKLDRKLAAAQRKAGMHEAAAGQRRENPEKRTWSFERPASYSPAQCAPEASDEERLMILRMLEQKKISLAEAEQLLDALEGKAD